MDEQNMRDFNNNDGAQIIAELERDVRPPRRHMNWGMISLVLIILGVVLFAAGWASGSRGGRVYFNRGIRVVSHPQDIPQESGYFNFAGQFTAIHAHATARNVTFVHTNEPTVSIVTNNSRNLRINEDSGRLEIDARVNQGVTFAGTNMRRWQFLNFGSHGVSWNRVDGVRFLDFNFDFANFSLRNMGDGLRIYVPSGVTDISTTITSGNVRMYDISTTTLDLRTTSGRVAVEGGTHESARLRTTSGNVSGNAYFPGNLYARTTSGNVNITDHSTAHNTPQGGDGIQLRATSGNVNFSTNAPASQFSYNLSATSGSMRVNGNRYNGRRASGGSGATPIDASTTSGNVRVDFGR